MRCLFGLRKKLMTISFSYLSKIFPTHSHGVTSRLFWTISTSPASKRPRDVTKRCRAGNRILRLQLPLKPLRSSLPVMKCSLRNFRKENLNPAHFSWNRRYFRLSLRNFRSEHFMTGNELLCGFRGSFKRRSRFPARQHFVTSLCRLEAGFVEIVQNRRDRTPLLWIRNIFDKYEKLLVLKFFWR